MNGFELMLGDQQESEYAGRLSGLKFITYCETEFYVGRFPAVRGSFRDRSLRQSGQAESPFETL